MNGPRWRLRMAKLLRWSEALKLSVDGDPPRFGESHRVCNTTTVDILIIGASLRMSYENRPVIPWRSHNYDLAYAVYDRCCNFGKHWCALHEGKPSFRR